MTEPKPPRSRPSDMDVIRSVWEEARDLIARLEGSSVERFSVQAGETKIEIERKAARPGSGGAFVAAAAPAESATAAPTPDGAAADGRHPVLAPLVGTFYRASEPGAKPFVEEGDVVDEGQSVAIVEAMKLMNQVSADRGGRVAEIVATDGEWVEFEQVLMYLEPIGD
jgi:acetyl-CoA carboxylase biotin carboxyl carrier protein